MQRDLSNYTIGIGETGVKVVPNTTSGVNMGLHGLGRVRFRGATQQFHFPRASAAQNAADLPDLFTAFQEQLGWKLEAPVDILVIDKVSKPPEN